MTGDTTSLDTSGSKQPIQLKGYEFLRELGAGGAGAVWLARQHEPQREVAIKLIPISSGDKRDFTREANLQARLSHPNLVDVYQAGIVDGHYFIVMPYLEGGTLQDRLAHGKLDTDSALRIGVQIAEALGYLHGEKLVHRDLKPGNILFDGHGNALLADFGITNEAHITGEQTRQGQASGTPSYMSPEQIRCEPLDHRSDLYSLGVLLFECLCGHPPFVAKSNHELLQCHLSEAAPRLRKVGNKLAGIVDRLLRKSPVRRYTSANEVKRALEDVNTTSILDAFKRKSVLRNSGYYILATWVLLQVMDVIGDIWEISGLVKQGLFVVLIIGLPVVSLLSWIVDIADQSNSNQDYRFGGLYRPALAALLVVAVLVATIFTVHAWPDDNLDPEVAAFIGGSKSQASSDPKNFYYGLHGMDAPLGEDIFRYGRFYVESEKRLGQWIDSLPSPKKDDWTWNRPANSLKIQSPPCDLRVPQCVARMALIEPEFDEAERVFLDRYRQIKLATSTADVETRTNWSHLPPYQLLIQAAEMRLWRILNQSIKENPSAVWDQFIDEWHDQRVFLEDANLIVGKMIAAGTLEKSVHVYSLMLEFDSNLPPLEPLTMRERSMVLPLSSEFSNYLATDKDSYLAHWSVDEGSAWRRLGFQLLPLKRNRTMNRYGSSMVALARASLLPPSELDAQFDQLYFSELTLEDWIFNGAMALIDDTSNFHWRTYLYAAQVPDLFITLANVKRRMLREGITEEDLSRWLDDLPPRLRNAFTGEAPVIVEGMLRFELPGGIGRAHTPQVVIDYPIGADTKAIDFSD